MPQIYSAVYETVFRFIGAYGPIVAYAILLLVAMGIALRVISRLLPRGGPTKS